MVGENDFPLTIETPTECFAKRFCGCDLCPFYKWCDKQTRKVTYNENIKNRN